MDALALLAYMIAMRYRSGLTVIEQDFQDVVDDFNTLRQELDDLHFQDILDLGFSIDNQGRLCQTYAVD